MPTPTQSIPAQTGHTATAPRAAIAHNSAGYVKASESGASFIYCPFRGGSGEKWFASKARAIRCMERATQSPL